MSNESIVDRGICEPSGSEAAKSLPPGIAAGAEVSARGDPWIVSAIVPHDDCTALHLVHVATGHPRVLLWPFDRPVARARERRLRVVTLRRWWRHVAAIAQDTRVAGVRARAAGAGIVPYQLAPALAVVRGVCRVFLADEVGLGKTVEAGWIVADLWQRSPDPRVLIAVPAGLRRQWQSELAAHFDLETVAADAIWLRRAFAELPADVNPWSLPGIYITSLDFVKRADVLRSIASQSWDALVVDEAHTAAAPTDRHAALSRVAARSRVVVLITATPFSGDTGAFASLVRLGTRSAGPPLMFRRSREDAGLARARRHRFAAVRITAAERRLQRMLDAYTREVWAASHDEGARLAMTVLRKRALSSPQALARSLDRRIELLNTRPSPPRQLTLFDDETVEDDEPLAALAVPGLDDAGREQRWLTRLAAAAQAAPDSKEKYLLRLLARLRGEAAIVFTEYRDTLRRLAVHFPGCLLLHGGMTASERAAVQARFNAEGGLLLATDAASEGLNLQHRCRLVVCYELPWNPARLEQRVGRVDRIGQSRRVHGVTLVARDTAEDLVIANLARRLERVSRVLGERDRLAAYLTEARTAGIVIGGASPSSTDGAGLPPIATETSVGRDAHDEADRVAGRERTSTGIPRAGDILVSSIRASRAVGSGYVLVFDWAAVVADGRVVDRYAFAAHVPNDRCTQRPVRAGDARRIAESAAAAYERHALEIVTPLAAARLDRVREAHEGFVDRAIAREVELRDWQVPVGQVQPGLFDRRAVARADELATAQQHDREQHEKRIASLNRDRPIEQRLQLTAVLIVYGRRGA